MEHVIYTIFNYLTDIPVNIWIYFLILTSPVLVFLAKPESDVKIRLLRLLFAIGCTYVLINLSLHTGRAIDWKQYEECQKNSIYRDMSIEMEQECGHYVNIADGASAIFYLILGWIPATAYVGIWELLWRINHRKKIKELGKDFKGKWMSRIILYISFPVWIYCSIILLIVVYASTCHLFSSSDKCFHSDQASLRHKK